MKEITEINVLLDEGAEMPTQAHSTDAGFDIYAKEDFVVPPCKMEWEKPNLPYAPIEIRGVSVGCASHDTGVHIEIPKGYAGNIESKSGLNVRHGLTCQGLIDCGYTGSIVVKLFNHTDKAHYFNKGDKIAQLVIRPILTPKLKLVTELEETERGNGGFGSTGR